MQGVTSKYDRQHTHYKITRDPEKGPFRVNDDSEISQTDTKWVRLTQLWVIFRIKLTDFRVIVDPEWSCAPMDPFPSYADPGVFRVQAGESRHWRL